MNIFQKMGTWLAGVSSKVWNIIFPLLKSAALQFAADMEPIIKDAIKQAATRSDLDNSGKFNLVKDIVTAAAKKEVTTYKDSYINLAIELVYQNFKESTDTTTQK